MPVFLLPRARYQDFVMDATEKVTKVGWRKYEGKWELMWVFVLVHPPFFGKGCVRSLGSAR